MINVGAMLQGMQYLISQALSISHVRTFLDTITSKVKYFMI